MAKLFLTTTINNLSQGAYQKSEKAEWTGHFENEIGITQEFSLKLITAVQASWEQTVMVGKS